MAPSSVSDSREVGLYFPPHPTSPFPSCVTAPAYLLADVPEPFARDCAHCVAQSGLCGRDDCRRAVLPQLAQNGGWLRLMGEAHVEQKDRQDDTDLPVSIEQVEWKRRKQQARSQKLAKARKQARAVARSQRRGAFGLAKQIAGLA